MSLTMAARPSGVPRPGTTKVVLMRGDTEVATWALGDDAPIDLSLVDQLARLQLAARRMGCWITLRQPSGPLCELLDLVGLADVLTGGCELVVEVGREAEGGEQVLGVEEAVEPGDPVA
jgi:hypothetical protein